jgi:hypothetical protein
MSRVSGALCSLLSDAGGALLVVGNRCGGEHLLHVERQCGGWHVDVVVEQESPHEHSQPRKRHTSPSGSVYFAASSAEVLQIWAPLVAFALQDRLGHVLRSRAGRVDEHW